ncbi:helicase-related protein [Massilibacterium senegalense]|uniref:helicase-related protein n=1 Tax=Massilibacterium senegalense TaxID=1632858 RepID=UPI000782CFAB|nr:helicase-related protein [Massilibacterium senegalense]
MYITANYIDSDHNFVIQNMKQPLSPRFHPSILAILKNILQRGCPAEPSRYLKTQFPNVSTEPFRLLPAHQPSSLVATRLTEDIPEYPFLSKLLVPDDAGFYIECTNTIIELDGKAENDCDGKVFSFTTEELTEKSVSYQMKMHALRQHLKRYDEELSRYRSLEEVDADEVRFMSVMRWQWTIIALLEHSSEQKDIEIKEAENLRTFDIALHDINLWLEALCTLHQQPFEPVQFNVRYVEKFQSERAIKIDMSVVEREGHEIGETDVLFIRTARLQKPDHFKLETTAPVTYAALEESALLYLAQNLLDADTLTKWQVAVITNLLQRRHTIGMTPTGKGNMICYVLAALLQPTLHMMIVPIPSFMYDAIKWLESKKITRMYYVKRNQHPRKNEPMLQAYRDKRCFGLLVAPEYFQTESFRMYVQQLATIGFVMIEDAHCLSEWSDNFRTSYLHIGKTIRTSCKQAVILATTKATSMHVLQDVQMELQIEHQDIKGIEDNQTGMFQVIKTGHDYEDKQQRLTEVVQKEGEQSGIVFTLHANGEKGSYALAQRLADSLQTDVRFFSTSKPKNFHPKVPYYRYNRQAQLDFEADQFPVLVATKPFEMGTNKQNVRYTVHYGLPESLSLLVQEAGRAGKEGTPATHYLLYTKDDVVDDDFTKLFAIHTTINDAKQLVHRYGYKASRDILSVFSLWLKARPSVKTEAELMYTIFDMYATPNGESILHSAALNKKVGDIQRALARLSLVGVVQDWMVQQWGQKDTVIRVQFHPYTEESIEQAILSYIRKYDANFSLKLSRVYQQKNEPFVLRIATIFLKWMYALLFYQQRMSFHTLLESCEQQQLNETITGYFQWNERTNQLAEIAAYPDQYEKWFAFCTTQDASASKLPLVRYLETYRTNVGLNFISGINRLVLHQFSHLHGRNRFIAAWQAIQQYPEATQQAILLHTLQLGKTLEEEQKQQLSAVLLSFYPNQNEVIYDYLQDNYTLHYILTQSIQRIQKVGGTWND